jgi:signal transduction histidine kinase/CheY-like chemotaxis protein
MATHVKLTNVLHLDEPLNWLAETVQELRAGRFVSAILLGLVAFYKLPPLQVALWLTAILICEVWQWRAGFHLLKADAETPKLKRNFMLSFAFTTLAWSILGDLAWRVDGGAYQATCMVLWTTQFMLAAVYAFRSTNGCLVGAAAPMGVMLFAVIPTLAHLDPGKVVALAASGPAAVIAYTLSRQTHKQRQVLATTLEQLEQAAKEAADAASAKSEFLANMSHELRTPLTAILGFSELLQKSKTLAADDARSADRITTASRTLLTVVNDVLDFSKMEAGAVELEAEALDPVRLMQDALDVIDAAGSAKGLGVRLEATGMPVAVVGDAVRLRQVLFNLVSNALKFTSRGEIVGAVAFEPLGAQRCRVRFEVRDTGIGIPDDKRALMFERFSQADGSITRRFGGTGLGLAICKHIVTLMNGVIDVDSQLGEGSVFWLEVDLPVVEGRVAEPSDRAVDETEALDVHALVAEDHPANQELLRIILETVGIKVHVVGDGAQAVDAYRNGAFDIILMDVHMPVMDGPEATRRIRALEGQGPRTPIIAMTANVMSDQVRDYLAAGMDAHVGKPIDSRTLIETLADWIARSDATRAAESDRAA